MTRSETGWPFTPIQNWVGDHCFLLVEPSVFSARPFQIPSDLEYLHSLRDETIQFYSCFISYFSKDQVFADRLHADLQNKGIRCWFALHDLPTG